MREMIDKILITEDEISKRVAELGKELEKEYGDRELVVIGILKGSVTFMSDLIRHIDKPILVDYMAASSYEGSESTGHIKISKDITVPIKGKDVLIVEDIIDTGNTLSHIIELFKEREARSVKTITLLTKPSRRQKNVEVEYIGFEIPDYFVAGYGLDYNQIGRNLPFVGVLKEEYYK